MAIAWTAIALLGTAVVSLITLATAALFQLRSELRTEIGALRAEMNAGFDSVRAVVRALGDRLTAAGA